MKRIFALLLCLAMSFAFVACEGGETNTDSSASTEEPVVSDTDSAEHSTGTDSVGTQTDTSSDKTDQPQVNVQLYDPDMEHKVIMDDSATKILIADLNLCGDNPEDIDMEECIIWEWDTKDAKGAKMQGKSITMDEALLRYSAYWKKDVVVFCGSGGWVGIVDYETKQLLFEDNPGNGPHSVELLPNGDLVLACSGNSNVDAGKLIYYPLSQGKTKSSSTLPLRSAHGVCWDPTNKVIWALGGSEIIGCTVASGKLVKVEGMGASLTAIGQSSGHDMVPVYGQPGRYWVSSAKKILQFDANEGTLTDGFVRSQYYNGKSVKGIAWFADGTMLISAHNQGGTGTYRSAEFRFLYLKMSEGKVKRVVVDEIVIPHRQGSQTYKIHALNKEYQ